MTGDSLKKKIGQMLMVGFDGLTIHEDHPIAQAILAEQLGGVILFDYNFKTKQFVRNIQNPNQLKKLTQQLQTYAQKLLLIGVDYEGGAVNRLKTQYGFPPTKTAEEVAALDFDEIKYYAEQMAMTLKSVGINLNFAPVLDVNINLANPIIAELHRSFSADPNQVIQVAEIFYQAFVKQGIIATYKHFPGHGSAEGDTHLGCVDVTKTWQSIELLPYQKLLTKSENLMVMTAHIVHQKLDAAGYPASLSYAMIQKLLRNKLHFDGVVITDDLQMKAITDQYGLRESLGLAIQAGADILLVGNQLGERVILPQEMIEWIYQDVQNGKISVERIDQSYQRILNLKSVVFTNFP